MRVHIETFLGNRLDDMRQRRDVRLLIERMENDPRALDDMGLTFEQFAERQWQALEQEHAMRRARRRSRASRAFNASFPWRILPDSLALHRTPSVQG